MLGQVRAASFLGAPHTVNNPLFFALLSYIFLPGERERKRNLQSASGADPSLLFSLVDDLSLLTTSEITRALFFTPLPHIVYAIG